MPAVLLVTKPEEDPIVATVVLLLVQVPPPVPSDSEVVSPAHREVVPVIGDNGLTVTVVTALQPVDKV